MNLTPFEVGQRSPAELFAAETRRNVIARRGEPRPRGVPEPERSRRQALAVRARRMFDTNEAMGRELGTTGAGIAKWFTGERPVPVRYLEALEEMARGGQ